MSESKKFSEIKESFQNLIQIIELVSYKTSEFLVNQNKIKQNPKEDLNTIYSKLIKDLSIDENCFKYFFEIHTKDYGRTTTENTNNEGNNEEVASLNNIQEDESISIIKMKGIFNFSQIEKQKLYENLCFLNKDELVIFKDFKTEFLKEVYKIFYAG